MRIAPDERLVWERNLNQYLRGCGCAESSFGLISGLSIAVAICIFKHDPWKASDVIGILMLPIILLIGGRLTGQWLAKLHFRNLCKELLVRVNNDK